MRSPTLSTLRCLVALLAFPVLHARAADIDWNPSWKAGDKAVYEAQRCRKSSDAAKPANACANGSLEIEVLRADDKGSLQRWKTDTAIQELAKERLPAEMTAAIGNAASSTMEIEFDASAQPVRLVNAKEVRAMLHSVVQALTEPSAGRKELDPKMVEQMRSFMSQLTATDERLLALVAKDASILYGPLGGSFRPNKTLRVKSSTPSPFGTAPIPSMVSVTTKVVDSAGKVLELQFDEEIDRVALTEAMDGLLKPLIERAGRPEKVAELREAMSKMTLRRTTTYQGSIDSSWARSVRWSQKVDVSGRQRFDTIEFKKVR